ncbi:MAG: DPP IV N-terminal domain-containing protein [Candidatus Wallbacteria bacterium]|nr:DPP IV N-terminal domain-containing protein [Candidatus Wallbacteria bacterium]
MKISRFLPVLILIAALYSGLHFFRMLIAPKQVLTQVRVNLEFDKSKKGGLKKSDLTKTYLSFWQLTPITVEVSAEIFDPADPAPNYGKTMRNGDYMMSFGGFAALNGNQDSAEIPVLTGSDYFLFVMSLDKKNKPGFCGLKSGIRVLPDAVNSVNIMLNRNESLALSELAAAGIDHVFSQNLVFGSAVKKLPKEKLISLLASLPASIIHPGNTIDLSNSRIIGIYENGATIEITTVDWKIKSGGGTLTGNIYTAPQKPGKVVLTMNYQAPENYSADLALTVASTGPLSGNWRLAFVTIAPSTDEIVLSSIDGTQLTQLTVNWDFDSFPCFSPDGNRLIFQSNRNGHQQILRMSIDGGDVAALTQGQTDDLIPAYSPDGSRIAFTRLDGGKGEIYLMDADGGNQSNLTHNPADDYYPNFSPDGNQIVFVSDRDGIRSLYSMQKDGNSVQRLTTPEVWEDIEPRWSPTGDKIIFSSNRDGNYELYLINRDGSNPVRLTENRADDTYPAFSPDGGLIAFTSDRDGRSDIFLMHSDGSGPQRITNSAIGDYYAVFGTIGSPLISSISIAKTSETVFPGSTLDLGSLTVAAHFADGSTRLVNAASYLLTGPGQINGSIYSAPLIQCTAEITVNYLTGSISRSTIIPLFIRHSPQKLSLVTPKTVFPNQSISLPANGEVRYDSGLTAEVPVTWILKSEGTLTGNLFKAPARPGSARLSATYSENTPVSKDCTITVSSQPFHYLKVLLNPKEAAEGRWSLDKGLTWKESGESVEVAVGANYEIRCLPITGFIEPGRIRKVMKRSDTTEIVSYTRIKHLLTINIAPPKAGKTGRWSLNEGTTWRLSGTSAEVYEGASFEVIFKPVPGFTTPPDFSGIMSGTDEARSADYSGISHILTVAIAPEDASCLGACWTPDGGANFKASGETMEIQEGTSYEIQFKAVPGYSTPMNILGIMCNSDTCESVTYSSIYRILTVSMLPDDAVSSDAQWSVDGSTWHSSGATVEIAKASSCEVTFKPVAGFITPRVVEVPASPADVSITADYSGAFHSLTVSITPEAAVTSGACWSCDGGEGWNDSGASIEVQEGATLEISFYPVPDFLAPADITLEMGSTDCTESIVYLQLTHILTVTISPAEAVAVGCGWRLSGENWWRKSGETVEIAESAPYTIECMTVAGWNTPTPIAGVMPESDTSGTVIYTPALAAPMGR